MPSEYQKELFEEFKKKKSRFEKIADKLTRRKRRPYIHMPLENVIFAIIIVVMCIVVAFALGVERGKRFAPIVAQKESASFEEEISAPPIELKPIETGKLADEDKADLPYTIQLISYKQKHFADREVNKLLNKKIDAFLIPGSGWYQVCAGHYGSMKDAKEALAEFEKEYKGCFIRNK